MSIAKMCLDTFPDSHLGSPNRLSTTKKDVIHETVKRNIGLSFRYGALCRTDACIDVAGIRKTSVLVGSGC